MTELRERDMADQLLFNTLGYIDRLKRSGIPDEQAEPMPKRLSTPCGRLWRRGWTLSD